MRFAGIRVWPLLLGALLAPFAGTVPAQQEAGTVAAEQFRDWAKACRTPEGAETEVCFVFQNATPEDGERVVMNLLVHYPPEGEGPVMVVTLPLGLALLPGIRLQVDDGATRQVPFRVCNAGGCKAVVPLADELLAELRRGEQLHVTVASIQGEATRLTTSLLGFTAAMTALR